MTSSDRTLVDRFRKWFEYEKDAHEKTRRSLETVPEEKRASPEFQRALDLVAHIMAARRLWLHRFGATSEGPQRLEDVFPKGVPLSSLEAREREMHGLWSDYLKSLDGEELRREFEYRAIEGERFRNRVEDVLTQLFGHSWYHRGQVASVVRALGGTPAVTDYIFWVRERLE